MLIQLMCSVVLANTPACAGVAPLPRPVLWTHQGLDLEELRAEILATAEELAEWADDSEFESGRNRMYAAILAYDPDHKDARRALGFRKRKGEWTQGRIKEPKDDCEPQVPAEFERRWAAAVDAFEARIVEAFAEGDDSPSGRARERAALSALVPFGPNDESLRTRLGDVFLEDAGVWVMAETRAARERRRDLADRKATLIANFDEPRAVANDAEIDEIDLPWTQALSLGGMTMMSTLEEAETRTLLETAQLMRQIFPYALPGGGRPSYPNSIWAVEVGERSRFFKGHPRTPAAELDYRIAVNSSWLDNDVLVSGKSPKLRKDVTAFQVAGYGLAEKFGVRIDDGWAQQGLTSYLAYLACETRLSFWDIRVKDEYGNEIGGARNWLERVPPDTGGWLLAFVALVEEGQTMQEFARALTSPTVKMDWKDVVTSHAFSAFLLEARPDDLIALLNLSKNDESMVIKVERQLEVSLPELRERMVRWVNEIEVEVAPAANPDEPADDAEER